MSLSLYEVMIPTYLQTLGAVRGLLEKGEKFCAQAGLPPEEILEARLAPDMQPFTYQVKSTAVHSLGAIEGVRRGVFSPDQAQPPAGFAALASRIDATIDALRAIDPAEVEAFVGRDMRFVSGSRQLDFTAESFLLSFSQPNFFFHAATTYDILRWKGAPIGKRDFMGPMRRKS